MPPLPPVASTSRVVLEWTWAGQLCANVLHYLNTTGSGGPQAADIGAKIVGNFNTATRAVITTGCALTRIGVTPLDPSPPPSQDYATGLPLAGTSGSPSMPNNVTAAASFRTAFRGRSFRGRAFVVGLTEAGITANAIEPTVITAWLNFWEAMRVLEPTGGEATYQLAVVSYMSGGVLRPVPIATPVTSITMDGIVDTQRRRLPGRGN